MSFRYFRKQKRGIDQTGKFPAHLRGGELVGGTIFMAGRLLSTTDFGTGNLSPTANDTGYVAKFDGLNGNVWAARFYISNGTKSIRRQRGCIADRITGDVYMVMSCNGSSIASADLVFENADGTVGATVAFVNTLSGTTRDCFCVKYDASGTVQWAVNVIQLPNTLNTEIGTEVMAVSPAPVDEVILFGQVGYINPRSGTGNVTWMPNDPNAESAAVFLNNRDQFALRLDKATGAYIPNTLNLIGDLTPFPNTLVQSGLSFGNFSSGTWARSTGEYVITGATSDNDTPVDQPYSSINTSPVEFLRPTGALPSAWGLSVAGLVNTSDVMTWGFQISRNTISGPGIRVIAQNAVMHPTDGVVFFGRDTESPDTVLFRDIVNGNINGPVIATNSQPFMVRYDESGNLLWHKTVTVSGNTTNAAINTRNSYMTSTELFAQGLCRTVGAALTFTWGPGEANQTSYTFPAGGDHYAFSKFAASSGDLQWVQPLVAGGSTPDIRGEASGVLASTAFVLGIASEEVTTNVFDVADTLNFGAGELGVFRGRFDPTSGDFIALDNIFSAPATDYTVVGMDWSAN